MLIREAKKILLEKGYKLLEGEEQNDILMNWYKSREDKWKTEGEQGFARYLINKQPEVFKELSNEEELEQAWKGIVKQATNYKINGQKVNEIKKMKIDSYLISYCIMKKYDVTEYEAEEISELIDTDYANNIWEALDMNSNNIDRYFKKNYYKKDRSGDRYED